MADLLLVVDVQKGFIDEKCHHIIPNIEKLINAFNGAGKLVVFTRFINRTGSEYERFIHWSKLKEYPEIDIIDDLKKYAIKVFDKTHYTPFLPPFELFLKQNNVSRIFICGVATDSCVMKSAIDSFEHGIEPIVAIDASYTDEGEEAHNAGLLIISLNIGKEQLKETKTIIHDLTSD